MSSPETILRHDHRGDPAGFLRWAARATRGEYSIYHTGNLAADRINHAAVEEIANLALLLDELRWVNAMQCRQSIAHPMDYIAVRTGEGNLPRSIASRAISATDYRILSGVQAYSLAPNSMSMPRAIRGMMPIGSRTSDGDAAQAIFKRFRGAGWIEPREGNRNGGWTISTAGLMMLR